MTMGYALVTARRAWLVQDVSIWGLPSLGDYDYLAVEEIAGTYSVLYGSAAMGSSEQEVLFSQLTDHRGNQLPQTLSRPMVIPRTHSADAVFVLGAESDDRFRIARDPNAVGPVTTDLLVLELGE